MRSIIYTILFFGLQSLSFAQGVPEFLEIATNFNNPVVITNAGDGSNRLFVVEKAGYIRIIDLNTGLVLPDPFLDIDAIVESSANEEGLLGLTFHPSFETNGYLYVYYITPEGTSPTSNDSTKISRFQVSPTNPNLVDPLTELQILKFYQPAGNHNAGDIHFGPDGFLYIASGDGGGSGGSGSGFSQSTSSLLGKILRIDIDGDDFPLDDEKNYSIPTGNPYVSIAGADEIWHLGLRNPWKFSFDRETGDMYIADVGQNSYEEVDVALAGVSDLNFGWKCREGAHQYAGMPCGASSIGFTEPIFEYDHTASSRSITGGYVYRGANFENFKGWYFVADYLTNELWRFEGPTAANQQLPIETVNNPSSFGESESGELYIASYGGRIYRIIDRSVCPEILTLPTVSDSINLAEISITSDAALGTGNIRFFAGSTIDLEEGFMVPHGTMFLADIGVCGKP